MPKKKTTKKKSENEIEKSEFGKENFRLIKNENYQEPRPFKLKKRILTPDFDPAA